MNEPKKPIVLTVEERRSPLFLKLLEHWTNRLEISRMQNDGDRPEIETAKLRGRIAELKACIDLSKESPPPG